MLLHLPTHPWFLDLPARFLLGARRRWPPPSVLPGEGTLDCVLDGGNQRSCWNPPLRALGSMLSSVRLPATFSPTAFPCSQHRWLPPVRAWLWWPLLPMHAWRRSPFRHVLAQRRPPRRRPPDVCSAMAAASPLLPVVLSGEKGREKFVV
jgi:hypothetical protein